VQVDNPNIYLFNLYLFERRRSVEKVPQVIDCSVPARADYVIPEKGNTLTVNEHVKQTTAWRELTTDDPLFIKICTDEIV